MPKYVMLGNWTDKGAREVRDTVKRSRAAREEFAAMGVNAREWIFTMGLYDVILTVEAPDDETLSRAAITLAEKGNMRTQTLRGFSEKEVERMIKSMK